MGVTASDEQSTKEKCAWCSAHLRVTTASLGASCSPVYGPRAILRIAKDLQAGIHGWAFPLLGHHRLEHGPLHPLIHGLLQEVAREIEWAGT